MTFWTHRKYKHRKYQWSDLLEKSDALPPMFPAKLAAFLSSMPNIEELKLNIPIDSSPLFGRAFSDALLTLQRVKKLNIGEEGLFAISHCPNLEEIAMSGFVSPGETINAASNLKHLKRIELSGDLWNVTHSNSMSNIFHAFECLCGLNSSRYCRQISSSGASRLSTANVPRLGSEFPTIAE